MSNDDEDVLDIWTEWFVHIERDNDPDVLIGPYPTGDAAEQALNHALLVQGLCEEDASDCYIEPIDVCLIDRANPDHTGVPA